MPPSTCDDGGGGAKEFGRLFVVSEGDKEFSARPEKYVVRPPHLTCYRQGLHVVSGCSGVAPERARNSPQFAEPFALRPAVADFAGDIQRLFAAPLSFVVVTDLTGQPTQAAQPAPFGLSITKLSGQGQGVFIT